MPHSPPIIVWYPFDFVYNSLNIRHQEIDHNETRPQINCRRKGPCCKAPEEGEPEDLAARAQVSPSLLSQIENSKTNPFALTLHNIATALNVPITYFFPDSEAKDSPAQPSALMISEKAATELQSDNQAAVYAPVLEQHSPVLHPNARVFIELMGGVRWQRLTSSDEDHIQFLEIHYPPSAASGSVMSRHVGQELGIVLEGELTLAIGLESYLLTAGDSIIFASSTPHRLLNEGAEPVRAIWIDMNWSR